MNWTVTRKFKVEPKDGILCGKCDSYMKLEYQIRCLPYDAYLHGSWFMPERGHACIEDERRREGE